LATLAAGPDEKVKDVDAELIATVPVVISGVV
jgi:hypothetical protein